MAGWGMAPTMERELPPVASEDEPLVDQLTTFLARKEALNESFGGPWNGYDFEYLDICRSPAPPCVTLSEPVIARNRYLDIVPVASTRVTLTPQSEDPAADYINANFVDGATADRSYIAAQGPLPTTIGDFWRMILETGANTIVMLTNMVEAGIPKCVRYWPSQIGNPENATQTISISMEEENNHGDYCERVMTLRDTESGTTRMVRQFHYLEWPDHGVPKTAESFRQFMDAVTATDADLTGPMVVHCSAGIGRTGVFCTVDPMLRKLRTALESGEGAVSEAVPQMFDVAAAVKRLREQRVGMVQTKEQYVFCYIAVGEEISDAMAALKAGTSADAASTGEGWTDNGSFATDGAMDVGDANSSATTAGSVSTTVDAAATATASGGSQASVTTANDATATTDGDVADMQSSPTR